MAKDVHEDYTDLEDIVIDLDRLTQTETSSWSRYALSRLADHKEIVFSLLQKWRKVIRDERYPKLSRVLNELAWGLFLRHVCSMPHAQAAVCVGYKRDAELAGLQSETLLTFWTAEIYAGQAAIRVTDRGDLFKLVDRYQILMSHPPTQQLFLDLIHMRATQFRGD